MRKTEATIRTLGIFALALGLLRSSKTEAEPAWVVAVDRPVAIAGMAPFEQWARSVATPTGGIRALTFERQAEAVSAQRIKSEVRSGRYACGALDVGALVREGAIYGAAEIPFLAIDAEGLARLFDRWRPMLERRFAEDGLKLVMLLPGAPRVLVAPPATRRIGDLTKLAVAAPGAAGTRLVELIGARHTADRPDAAFTSLAEAKRWQRQAPEVVLTVLEGWRGAVALVCGTAVLDALPTPERAEMLAAALDIEDAAWAPAATATMGATGKAQVGEGERIEKLAPPRGLVSELARLGAQMAREWATGAGADGVELIAGVDQQN